MSEPSRDGTAPRWVVGIDLGTTNIAMACADLTGLTGSPERARLAVEDVPLPQLVSPGETASRRLLPSALYLPGPHELPAGALRLPWGEAQNAVGELARRLGAQIPGRLVTSAKSWLCHGGVDRTAALLPWGAPEGVPRLSPVQATRALVAHLIAAWGHAHPDAPLGRQDVILTVPASFDDAARELTVKAARDAGLGRFRLLEEPLAAYYDLERVGTAATAPLPDEATILVCDVGGGTTDFTLIRSVREGAARKSRRIAVGDHILLGGDNMDLALARVVEQRLEQRLDATQLASLVAGCRQAKETLLSPNAPSSVRVTIPGRSARLIGSALSAELTPHDLQSLLVNGFFPRDVVRAEPRRDRRAGLAQLGLPYATDPAITAHLAAFLAAHPTADGAPRHPDAVLLNGGVFEAQPFEAALLDALASLSPSGQRPLRLEHGALDLAVARGATWFGLVRQGFGARVAGGTARAVYIEVDVPGESATQAVCVLPMGTEEGTEVLVPRELHVRIGTPVQFAPHGSTTAGPHAAGDVVTVDDAYTPLPPLGTTLVRDPRLLPDGDDVVSARLAATLTEVGTLAVHVVAQDLRARWKLELGIKDGAVPRSRGPTLALPKQLDAAKASVVAALRSPGDDPRPARHLVQALESKHGLGPRERWSLPLVRELADVVLGLTDVRKRSVDHERVLLWLVGFGLRPGFGAPRDPERLAALYPWFARGLLAPGAKDDVRSLDAWWVLWRRVAAGLGPAEQRQLLDSVLPTLKRVCKVDPKQPPVAPPLGFAELVRFAGSLERLAPTVRAQVGELLLARLEVEVGASHLSFALARLGARLPLTAGVQATVSAETASAWLERLLASTARPEALALPLVQLARRTGDRALDIDEDLRDRVIERLTRARVPEAQLQLVTEVVAPTASEDEQRFGEGLPAGLVLHPS